MLGPQGFAAWRPVIRKITLTGDSIDSILSGMAQLIVRNLDEAVVRELRAEAAREKISVEEAHRRVLRRALLTEKRKEKTLWERFPTCPLPEKYDDIFERQREPDRPIPDFSD